MSEETFLGYQDIGEKGFIEWSLNYVLDPIIECFMAVPEAKRYERILGTLSAPCCILGHIALNEEVLLMGFAQGIAQRRCPFQRELFNVLSPPTEEQLREGIPDSSRLVEYWRAVRNETIAYLKKLTPDQLRQRPERSVLREGDPNRDNPIREFFIMAIGHQNSHWGELRAICKILEVPMRR